MTLRGKSLSNDVYMRSLFLAGTLFWYHAHDVHDLIPHPKQNSLWELVNKTHQHLIAIFGFGEWDNCPLQFVGSMEYL